MHFNGVNRETKRALGPPLSKSLAITTRNTKIQAVKQVLNLSN